MARERETFHNKLYLKITKLNIYIYIYIYVCVCVCVWVNVCVCVCFIYIITEKQKNASQYEKILTFMNRSENVQC